MKRCAPRVAPSGRPWWVGHFATEHMTLQWNARAHGFRKSLMVPAICDAVLFVPAGDVPPLLAALRTMSATNDHLTRESLHFLPWYGALPLRTIWELPETHDSNPSKVYETRRPSHRLHVA